jgi:hypothetical protein
VASMWQELELESTGTFNTLVLDTGDKEWRLQLDLRDWREMGEPERVRVTVTALEGEAHVHPEAGIAPQRADTLPPDDEAVPDAGA